VDQRGAPEPRCCHLVEPELTAGPFDKPRHHPGVSQRVGQLGVCEVGQHLQQLVQLPRRNPDRYRFGVEQLCPPGVGHPREESISDVAERVDDRRVVRPPAA
jgi:hypothetical protein